MSKTQGLASGEGLLAASSRERRVKRGQEGTTREHKRGQTLPFIRNALTPVAQTPPISSTSSLPTLGITLQHRNFRKYI